MVVFEEQIQVLLIDDDEDDYLITADLLQDVSGQHYQLDWIDNYDEGLQEIAKHHHDLYLIDYRLGPKSGLELLREAIAGGCEAPIILLTGLEDRQVDLDALKAGASEYLVKGQISPQLLDRTLRYAIENKRILKALRESERRKEIFVATLTHDLQTPIKAEYRVLELMKEGTYGELSDVQSMVVDELMQSNRYMHRMIDDLLFSYKIEDCSIELKFEEIDLGEVFRQMVMSELKVLADEKHIELSFDNQCNLQREVPVDPIEIKRVLYNLVQNAISYTSPNGRIHVKTQSSEHFFWASIQDSGPGIEALKVTSLFKPYASMAKKFRSVGTGLGLYLSQQIIEAHGGTISIESELGKGTRFFFYLPLIRRG
jgi:signal transduction histidine kinase